MLSMAMSIKLYLQNQIGGGSSGGGGGGVVVVADWFISKHAGVAWPLSIGKHRKECDRTQGSQHPRRRPMALEQGP